MSQVPTWLENGRYVLRHPFIRTALIGLAFLLLTTGIAFAYWWPGYRQYQSLVTQIETQRRAAVDALHAADLARAYREAQLAANALEKKLNASGGQADLVKNIEKLVSKHHVKIISQSYEEAKAKGVYLPLFLELSLQASYPSLREFLAELRSLPVWVEIQETSFERARDHAGVLKARIRLLTYRRAANHNVGT